jgi:hypothetical protein
MTCPRCGDFGINPTEQAVRERVGRCLVRAFVPGKSCPDCRTFTYSMETLIALEHRAAVAALLAGETGGQALRYARKALGFDRPRLGALLGVTPNQVESWERSGWYLDYVIPGLLVALLREQLGEPLRVEDALRAIGSAIQSGGPPSANIDLGKIDVGSVTAAAPPALKG